MFVFSQQVKEQREINLDILVENAGRVNIDLRRENRKGTCILNCTYVYMQTPTQNKFHCVVILIAGINGQVEVDGVEHKGWNMYALEFKSSFLYT